MSAENPTASVDALLESTVEAGALKVYPLTVARYALLELAESPLVVPCEGGLNVLDVIPSIYIMTAEAKVLAKYNSKNVDRLKEDAFAWAEDGVTVGSVPMVVNLLADKLLSLRRVAPEVVSDSKKKAVA